MDLWKFESILSKNALYFATAASQSDKLEGIPTTAEKLMRSRHYANLSEVHQASLLSNDEAQDEWDRRAMIMSCWHINDNLNPDAWDEYLEKKDQGIAIKTTQQVLDKNFEVYSHKQVFSGRPKYINRATYRPRTLKREGKIFQKQNTFSWENEYRYVIDVTYPPYHDSENILIQAGEWHRETGGYFIRVDIEALITDIYISPFAFSNFKDKVANLCNSYGLSPNIQ